MYKYPFLVYKITERGYKKKVIAATMGISSKALDNKIKGKAPWTWEQVQNLQHNFFPDIDKDDLMNTNWTSGGTEAVRASGE